MSWLRNTFARQLSRSLDPRHDYEPQACYSSFCKHWQQAYDIILRSQPRHLHDDVLAVVNHLEQMATLLVLEARAREINTETNQAACLEYLLSENLLDKLYEWAICTGKYENAVRLEELKLFGILITHYNCQVIAAEPFLRPLLKLLSGLRNALLPTNLENQLIKVLNQLCVVLMQNMKFIDLFFLTTHTQNGSQAEFVIARLLLAFVHRGGAGGAAARDALLLLARVSARCAPLAACLLRGTACPVLATGLSGLYSLLPRTLPEHVYRLGPDDVNTVHKLTLFIDSLEFCNAVAQVAHPTIKKYLLDLVYQGFLVPVLGPALLQRRAGALQSGAAEQAAATAYLELALRSVGAGAGAARGGLLRPALHFLLTYSYDGRRLLDVLLARLDGTTQLSLVSLSLMETLIDLNCEDVMIELVYKYLLSGHHLLASHRHKICDPESYREAAVSFLSLSPRCCTRPLEKTREWVDELALSGRKVLDFKRDDGRRVNGVQEGIALNNLVHGFNFNYGNPNETLFGNYHAYLCDARFEIVSKTLACASWSSKYDNIVPPKREANNNSTKEVKEIDIHNCAKEQDSLISTCTSGYDTLKTSDTSDKEPHSLTSLNEIAPSTETENSGNTYTENKASLVDAANIERINDSRNSDGKDHDSLTSIGESSGYDSFRYRIEDSEDGQGFAEDSFRKCFTNVESVREYDNEVPLIRNWRASAETIVGPLVGRLLRKAAGLLQAEVRAACRVTSLLSKMAALPSALLAYPLLCPGCVPNVPSLYQILSKLRDEVDELTSELDNVGELVDKARVFLVQREMALAKGRVPTNDDGQAHVQESSVRTEESLFRRGESKRRSFSSSLSNFARRLSSSSPSQHSSHSIQNTAYSPSPQKRLVFTQEEYWNQSITLRSILNAVILDEWVKELAALAEEHALRLSAENYEDDTYIRAVAL